jgi:hypothetical protein
VPGSEVEVRYTEVGSDGSHGGAEMRIGGAGGDDSGGGFDMRGQNSGDLGTDGLIGDEECKRASEARPTAVVLIECKVGNVKWVTLSDGRRH